MDAVGFVCNLLGLEVVVGGVVGGSGVSGVLGWYLEAVDLARDADLSLGLLARLGRHRDLGARGLWWSGGVTG